MTVSSGLERVFSRKRRSKIFAAELSLAVLAISLLIVTVVSPILSQFQRILATVLAILAGALTFLAYYNSGAYLAMPPQHRLLVEVLPEAVEPTGLSELEKRLLTYLAERGVLRPVELAEEWGVTPFTITSALLRLERSGYVRIRGITWE